ncbi:hypothetical protein PG995_014613 [Apiospora arundinis]
MSPLAVDSSIWPGLQGAAAPDAVLADTTYIPETAWLAASFHDVAKQEEKGLITFVAAPSSYGGNMVVAMAISNAGLIRAIPSRDVVVAKQAALAKADPICIAAGYRG